MFNSLWFDNLIKPAFAPPSSIFSPVWSILYLMIIVSFCIYFLSKSHNDKKSGYIFFTIQLLLNFLWSPTFFGLKNIGLALIIVVMLDLFVLFTIKRFYIISKIAGLLLVPYFIWILFATYLNFGYFVLN